MIELFASALVTFFVIIDPPGCAPIFASLTSGAPASHRRTMAIRSTLVATGILVFFALLGRQLLSVMDISLAAFRIAGGIMLFIIALDMVFETREGRRETQAEGMKGDTEHDDISVFPMGIPMIAGPGSIASAMLMAARAHGPVETMIVFGALACVMVALLLSLLAAGPLMKVLGLKVEAMLTRILGVIMAALAAQFVVDGIKESFGL